MTHYNHQYPSAPEHPSATSPPNFSRAYPPQYNQTYPPQYSAEDYYRYNNPSAYLQQYPAEDYYRYNNPSAYPQQYPANNLVENQQNMSSSYVPPGEDPNAAFNFTEQSIRLNFIRKVYSILTVQLLIVVAFVGVFVFEKSVQKYFQVNYGYSLAALVLVIVLAIMMACCSSVRRTAPMNFICLFVFTVAFSFLVGSAAALYSSKEVMLAMGMTAAITLGLTIFAFQTKIDFTKWGGALFALILILIVGGIFLCFFPSRIYQTILAGFGALVMSLYIIYDTQIMMGGKHRYSLSPEEYIFAALNLYLDIINLFLYILQLTGGRGN